MRSGIGSPTANGGLAGGGCDHRSLRAAAELCADVVSDWDDDAVWQARFKAFTGQRSDWEPRYLFWRSLVLAVARHLRRCDAPAADVRKIWFFRRGLTPLCIDQVLRQMHVDGDIILKNDLSYPSSRRLYHLVRRLGQTTGFLRSSSLLEDVLVFKPLIQERAGAMLKDLRESNWNSTCVISMAKFHSFFSEHDEAAAILCYLYDSQKAHHLVMKNDEIVEGLKLSLVAEKCPGLLKIDYDTLFLINCEEKLRHRISAMDNQWEQSKKLALLSFKSGNKQAAYRHIRRAKFLSESKVKSSALLEQVEGMIGLISDAESTKKVHEAIKVGNQAIKDYNMSIEEIRYHLRELDELAVAQKEVIAAIEVEPLQSRSADEEDLEEELSKLEEDFQHETSHVRATKSVEKPVDYSTGKMVESLSNKLTLTNLEAA